MYVWLDSDFSYSMSSVWGISDNLNLASAILGLLNILLFLAFSLMLVSVIWLIEYPDGCIMNFLS